MNRSEWLQRYRARYRERRPDLTAQQLDDLADIEAYDSLSDDYPYDPEAAADAEVSDWNVEDRAH